ncbi:RagB/SusD family nutrient uptake outer membrane protein [Maribellus sp. CM-23]|uniref:RagB/SusD family nutrient uptake outer membrane protein n=1 Tax=Maribellus sp. CM-23 TaxID=2781026 RepID=UPI001F2996B1|nr:RagB/SusD family nutrient uptake outer membrane protein [Maribellus sp. CM-23]MCE4565009.1 RagB/SusD family nutrient uptake outer membrane protein [Maribellus sp. CM-23]
MKKILIILIISSIFVSCSEEFLNIAPKGDVYPETFYATESDLEMAVTGVYRVFQELYFFGNALAYTTAGRDKTSKFNNFVEVDVFNAEGDNGEMLRFWAYAYQAINACNTIINNYEGADASEAAKKKAAGQAHFLRGYVYFQLVRMYNEIPFYLSEEEVSNDMPLTGPQVVYDLIIDDLKIAEDYLPTNWNDDTKRAGVAVTSGAAKSLLAYVYLSMAGYPLNDESKYALAASKAKEVIDNSGTWGYKLMENIADLYSKEFNYENRACEEVVLAFHNDNEWGCPKCGTPGEYGGWEVYMADINFFETYPEGPRKDAIFMWEFPMPNGTSKHYTELSSKHPWYKQYWDGKINWDKPWEGFDWKSSRPQVALTHSNNLLVYAEAKAMSSSPDASAYKAINDVRNRAGLPDLTEGLSQIAFRDSVVQERAWEFPGGYFCTDPWYDLVRLERVEASVTERNPIENQIVNQPTKEHYFAPYPSVDGVKNPNLAN